MTVLEIFSCSGGMAEGLRRAGLLPTMAFDYDAEARASYARNIGHAPIGIDARDLLRMIRAGWRPAAGLDLLVCDPPCTPWSRAGKRQGTEDERDMLEVTCEIVTLLRPARWLIANIPGLDDAPNWPTVQRTIGGLAAKSAGAYCIDFARLDAADYGIPQHRVRPFWFGHPHGTPCLVWPQRTHGSPAECGLATLPGMRCLRPWVTCRQALGHLPPEDLGAPVRLRWRGQNGKQIASTPDAPARVVGTSSLSDGNVLASPEVATRAVRGRAPSKRPRASPLDEPAHTVTSRDASGDGTILFDGPNHRPSRDDQPARTLTRNTHSDGALLVASEDMFAPSDPDAPSKTIRAAARGEQVLTAASNHPPSFADEPAMTVRAGCGGGGDTRHHPESGSILSLPNAVKLSEKAAAILQGFPAAWVFVGVTKRARWSQIGQAMPPPLAEAVARAIAKQMGRKSEDAAE